MAGSAGAPRAEAAKGPPRNSSIDSAISSITSRSEGRKGSVDSQADTTDISKLIKAAGSPEAVIQYLLKDKSSQSQQNAQLWRLVDKQRAMILGLNKDLERAMKDKEKYRKKLKELMNAQEQAKQAGSKKPGDKGVPRVDVQPPVERSVAAPESPTVDSDSQKNSPIDIGMAPYPITPPADQPNGPPSAVGELLDPQHTMPSAAEHAYDQFDFDSQERKEEEARKQQDTPKELPYNLSLPPSRSLPSEPPRMPPPKPPTSQHAPAVSVIESSPNVDEGLAQFPVPPPRKPPPAPLQLASERRPSLAQPREESETDTDYDDILEVADLANNEDRRGRRRTREEDDREREILARKEAEMRSLSKKSRKSTTPKASEHPKHVHSDMPDSATIGNVVIQRPNIPASLAGVLSGDTGERLMSPPILSPGLPSSPRPMPRSPMGSPPMSPRGIASFSPPPLSPRPPRQPIPLPPNTALASPTTGQPTTMELNLTSPKPLNIVKKASEPARVPSPPKSRESPTERTRIYTGFVTDEYPDLLLPPNALPSIDVRVASSRMKPSRASLMSLTQLDEDPVFTLAVFSRADGGELWRVEKDSMSLARLDARLKQCPAFTAKTPDRSLFTGHAPAKLDARRQALDTYLDELLNTPLDTATAIELCRYLSTNTLPPNTDETGSTESGEEGAEKRVGPGGRPYKSGYLTKKGKNFGGWKARFFSLDGPYLKYYETPGGAHLGTIKLQNAQIGKQSQSQDKDSPARGANTEDVDNQYRHAFLIMEPKKKDSSSHVKHVLCAESDKERDQWVEALLQWIDYTEEDDDKDKAAQAQQDRQGSASAGTERVNGLNAKRKMYGQGKSQAPTPEATDTLIGFSYEASKAGDTPQGAPTPRRPQTSGGEQQRRGSLEFGTMHSQSPYAISAPRDPHVISDAAAWGARSQHTTSLAPPGLEEKKARKRSFFGFGTKKSGAGNGGANGEDPLFGSEYDNRTAAPPPTEYRPPVRQVFGAPLAEAVRYNAPAGVSVPLPAVVYRCIQYLDAKNAIMEEGIFRLSGSNVVVKQLKERFNNESDVNLVAEEQYYDIHAVASLLKLYLRELPTTILTRDLHLEFLAVTEMPVQREKIAALAELVQRLPQANATLLKYLIAFLIKIINHSDTNKMTVRNVGIVFSPTLNIPAPVFAMFLQNYEGIFGIDPEEYELPSPASDDQQQQQTMMRGDRDRRPSVTSTIAGDVGRPSLDHMPPRPSTAGAAASPHRGKLLQDSIMTAQRSTPTPPPNGMGSMDQQSQQQEQRMPMRGTSSQQQQNGPPPRTAQQLHQIAQMQQMATNYEPMYLSQQQPGGVPAAGSHVSLRPAYESGFVLPPNFDPSTFNMPPPPRAQPTYDRPIFESPNVGYAAVNGNVNGMQHQQQQQQPHMTPQQLYDQMLQQQQMQQLQMLQQGYTGGTGRDSTVFMTGVGAPQTVAALRAQASQSRLREENRL